MQGNTTSKAYSLTQIALMAAVLCILGPLSIPVGPVPVSLQNMVIFLTLYVLGMKKGTAAYLIYFLLGAVGFPVFAGFSGGIQKVLGPTGGFLVGFIPMAVIAGLVIDRWWDKPVISTIGMYLSTLVPSLTGTLWYAFTAGVGIKTAVTVTVLPFLVTDLIKIAAVSLLGAALRRKLKAAGLFSE